MTVEPDLPPLPPPSPLWWFARQFTSPFGVPMQLDLLATTGAAGFALENGTPTILSWTAPDDGQQHRVVVISSLDVTSAETGGQVNLKWTFPNGSANADVLAPGGQAAGNDQADPLMRIVEAGKTVTVEQASALTAGAATLWAEIWGS